MLLWSQASWAQFADREDFQSHFKSYLGENNSVLSGSPLYHITPETRTITFAGGFDILDTTIAGDQESIVNGVPSDLNHYLELTGWTASPLVSISTRNFGFGFTSENGARQAHYVRQASTGQAYEETYSELLYSGFGLFVYIIPKSRRIPRWIIPNIIIGYKVLSAEQKHMNPRLNDFDSTDLIKYRYDVTKVHIGVNVGIRIARKFTIIPWYDYTSVNLGEATSDDSSAPSIKPASSSGSNSTSNTTVAESALPPYVTMFKSDRELFWNILPEKTYGLDLAVQLWRVDVHFGGILGALASTSKGSDRVYDNTYFLSASYSMRSR